MDLLTVFQRFPDQEACIEHLESVRWRNRPCCPLCGSVKVARKCERDRVGRWNCHDCRSSFNVLSGTIMAKTRVPLQKWFLAIAIMANAKKSVSAHQLARDLDLTVQTAHYVQQRIRGEMTAQNGDSDLLSGIIEADETYVGGKPRRWPRNHPDKPAKGAPRGRGTSKQPVIGVVERGGMVRAAAADDLSGKGILRFLRANVDPSGSMLITDEYPAYNAVRGVMPHAVINHSETYAEGSTHTNTIEGFWSMLKRAWYGTHHHYTRKFLPLYVAEQCWKYNRRRSPDAFGSFIAGAMAA